MVGRLTVGPAIYNTVPDAVMSDTETKPSYIRERPDSFRELLKNQRNRLDVIILNVISFGVLRRRTNKMAELIRWTFRESGMSLKRLSDESGTRYASVHAFFTAERDPQLSTIEAWSRVLGLQLVSKKRKDR